MSDYLRRKVIRYPFPQEILKKCNTKEAWDCENFLIKKLGDLFNSSSNIKRFNIEITDKAEYIDWIYYETYGEESGDFGNASFLTQNEINIIKPYFEKLEIEIDDSKFRKVDYCYYNCSECIDYYNLEELTEEELI